ncbi:hypothetical protein BGY98DRAFT_1064173 [Russula aff. rugulosa BPL654]|nr:hypothetical protein BGY98DRAFT_1064173 [Russula aff. rugulosa BPL654]
MSPSSPEAKPAQPKDAQDRSGAKDVVASSGEKERSATPTAKVEASAPVTNSQAAPVSTPPSSEKPPIVPSDSTPAPPDPEEDDDDDDDDQDTPAPAPVPAVSVQATPRVPDAQERLRRRKLLHIHTRYAKFFTWILLLGFVILPSTFTRSQGNNQGSNQGSNSQNQTQPNTEGEKLRQDAINHVSNLGLFAIGYSCCLLNGFAVIVLWRLNNDNPEWLFTNLFSAGLINAFSGLLTTFVNFFGVQASQLGPSTKSTLTLASFCTFVYLVLTLIYARKRIQARKRRGSRASSAMA